jgi:hypothetical protein
MLLTSPNRTYFAPLSSKRSLGLILLRLGPRKITEALQQIAEYDGLTLRSLRNDQPREHSIPIPAAPRLDSPPAVRNSVSYFSATEAGSLHGGLHVLIVDDNDINLKVHPDMPRYTVYVNNSLGLVYIHVENWMLLRHGVQRTSRSGEVPTNAAKVRLRFDGCVCTSDIVLQG